MKATQRAIILAAGRGHRLKPLSDTMPKPLTEVNGTPILVNALEHLQQSGVQTVCIVAGHLHDKITAACGTRQGDMQIDYIINKEYSVTNNAVSLWMAREYLQEGSLLLEADIFFERAVLQRLMQTEGSAWAADHFTPQMNGCRLRADSGGMIHQLEIVEQSDTVPPNAYKSAGMLKIEPPQAEKFNGWLAEAAENDRNVFFDLVIGRHLDEAALRICSVNGLRWSEIDDFNDLAAAERRFAGFSG